MTTENLITVLDLARMELEAAYKRLGYSNSNVVTSINESIVHLQREALSQAAVSGSDLDFTPNNLSNIFKNIKHKPCEVIGYDFAWDIAINEKFIGELFYSVDDKEWWFIKDNFPHQRKSYRINFPINQQMFVELFKTINVDLHLDV